jgi:hypothetical protein
MANGLPAFAPTIPLHRAKRNCARNEKYSLLAPPLALGCPYTAVCVRGAGFGEALRLGPSRVPGAPCARNGDPPDDGGAQRLRSRSARRHASLHAVGSLTVAPAFLRNSGVGADAHRGARCTRDEYQLSLCCQPML